MHSVFEVVDLQYLFTLTTDIARLANLWFLRQDIRPKSPLKKGIDHGLTIQQCPLLVAPQSSIHKMQLQLSAALDHKYYLIITHPYPHCTALFRLQGPYFCPLKEDVSPECNCINTLRSPQHELYWAIVDSHTSARTHTHIHYSNTIATVQWFNITCPVQLWDGFTH